MGGLVFKNRSVTRTDPMFNEMAEVISAVAVPTMNSVEPPPMSITSTGPASGRTRLSAPVKDSWASRSPLITSGSTPSRSRTPSKNASRFFASREAEVATKWIRSVGTPAAVINSAYASTAAKVRANASGWNSPVASTPWPSRTISVRRSRSIRPPPSAGSAISNRMELVPQSIAATVRCDSPTGSVMA